MKNRPIVWRRVMLTERMHTLLVDLLSSGLGGPHADPQPRKLLNTVKMAKRGLWHDLVGPLSAAVAPPEPKAEKTMQIKHRLKIQSLTISTRDGEPIAHFQYTTPGDGGHGFHQCEIPIPRENLGDTAEAMAEGVTAEIVLTIPSGDEPSAP